MEEEEIDDLLAVLMEGEILEIIHSFQKVKSLGPNVWPI